MLVYGANGNAGARGTGSYTGGSGGAGPNVDVAINDFVKGVILALTKTFSGGAGGAGGTGTATACTAGSPGSAPGGGGGGAGATPATTSCAGGSGAAGGAVLILEPR
ncbi:MAG: hypothetical protein LM580_03245 [Thermofilum sp.]|nr:hypothetical protein [Thermofilum sp.]